MEVPKVNYRLNQENNTISITVLSVLNTDRVVVRPQDSSEEVTLKGSVGDSLTVRGISSFEIIAIHNDEETCISQITTETDETDFEIENRTDMTINYAKERYVNGET